MTSLDEKFVDFYKSETSETFGGVNDTFSIKQIDTFKSELQSVKYDKQSDFINEKIQDVIKIDGDIRKMRENFEKLPENGQDDVFNNCFPFGEITANNMKSIDDTTLKQLTDSQDKFSHLCARLFPDIFKDYRQNELKSVLGTMLDYPTIDPTSFGLMPISGLQELFKTFYMNNNTGEIDKKPFFNKFLESLNINSDEIKNIVFEKDCVGIKDVIECYNFDTEYWYANTYISNKIDSYGYFLIDKESNKNYVFLKYSSDLINKIENSTRHSNQITELKTILERLVQNPDVNIYTDTYNYNRKKYKFNGSEFYKSIQQFFSNIIDNFDIKTFLTNFQTSLSSNSLSILDVSSDYYKQVRHFLNYSNIYTTYVILLSHFFTNIRECYNIYNKAIQKLKRKSITTNGNTSYRNSDLLSINKKIGLLIQQLGELILKLSSNLLEERYNSSQNDPLITANFAGFNTSKFQTPLNDFFITQYNIYDENQFKLIVQKYFFNHTLSFGGIPFSLDENEKYNKHILICLKFFLNYRILSNKTFLDYLKFLKKENDQRVTLTEYKSIEEVVRKKLSDIEKISLIQEKSEFEKCKIIIQYSIQFVNKLYLETFKSFRKTKNKNTLVDQIEIDKKIGNFKQNIYTFLNKLKDTLRNLKNITNFYLFISGYLLQYVYFLEIFNKTKNMSMIKSIKDLFSKQPKEFDDSLKLYAKESTDILTNPKSIETKKRWFFWRSEFEKLQSNVRNQINTQINPEILTSHYWVRYEEKFKNLHGDKKLFVIALEPVFSAIKKLSKVNVWMIDVFATVKSFTKPIKRDKIKTIEEFDKNNVVTSERYANDNNMILLNPVLRTIGEFKRYLKKGISQISGTRKSATAHLLQEFLGLRKKKLKVGDRSYKVTGYTHEEVFTLLIQGKLLKYTDDNTDKPVKMALLMGYDNYQLENILQTYYNNRIVKKQNIRRTDLSKEKNKDWQLYIIKNKDYQSLDNIRIWTNNLLNSKPWFFLENYLNKGSIPLSNFSNMQVPFESYFVKYQLMTSLTFVKTLPTLLLSFYDLIFKESDLMKNNGSSNISTRIRNKNNQKNIFISSEAFFDFDIPADFDYKVYLEKGNNGSSSSRNGSRTSGLIGLNSIGVSPSSSSSTGGPFSAFTGVPFTGVPFTGVPFTGVPFTGVPFTGGPFTKSSGHPTGRGTTPSGLNSSPLSSPRTSSIPYLSQDQQRLLQNAQQRAAKAEHYLKELTQQFSKFQQNSSQISQKQLQEFQQLKANKEREKREAQQQMQLLIQQFQQQHQKNLDNLKAHYEQLLLKSTSNIQKKAIKIAYQQALKAQQSASPIQMSSTRSKSLLSSLSGYPPQSPRLSSSQGSNTEQILTNFFDNLIEAERKNYTSELEKLRSKFNSNSLGKSTQNKKTYENKLDKDMNELKRKYEQIIQDLQTQKRQQLSKQLSNFNLLTDSTGQAAQTSFMQFQTVDQINQYFNSLVKSINNTYQSVKSPLLRNTSKNTSGRQMLYGESHAKALKNLETEREKQIQNLQERKSQSTGHPIPLPPNNYGNNNQSSQYAQLRVIIENNFGKAENQNPNIYVLHIEQEIFQINFNQTKPTISRSINRTTEIKKIEIDNTDYIADFPGFRIIFIPNNKIIKLIKIQNFQIELELQTDNTNGNKFWNFDFKNEFIDFIQDKPYYIAMNTIFQHFNYKQGFELYFNNSNYLLIIRGGNTNHSEIIIQILFKPNNIYFYIDDENNSKEFKIVNGNYIADIDGNIRYVIGKNKIFKYTGIIPQILAWNDRGYYEWTNPSNKNRNTNLQSYINGEVKGVLPVPVVSTTTTAPASTPAAPPLSAASTPAAPPLSAASTAPAPAPVVSTTATAAAAAALEERKNITNAKATGKVTSQRSVTQNPM